MSSTFKTSLLLRSQEDTDPTIGAPLKAVQQTMGMVPNMYAAMVNLPALLDTYNHAYRKFRGEAGFTPVEQEVVLLAISRANSCHYCVAAHSFVGEKMSKVPSEIIGAIRSDQPIADGKLEALRSFTRTMTDSRGNPTPEDGRAFLDAGYSEIHILGIILAISAKVISNYTNHIFHTDIDPAFEAHRWTVPNADA